MSAYLRTKGDQILVVKNTFLELATKDDGQKRLHRSASDPDMQSHSSSASRGSEPAGSTATPSITHAVWGAVDPPAGSSGDRSSGSSGREAMNQHIKAAMQDVQIFSDSESVASETLLQDDSLKEPAGCPSRAAMQFELHKVGKCTPCHSMMATHTCKKGDRCRFCHEPHQKTKPARPPKAKRAQCKKKLEAMEDLYRCQPGAFQDQVLALLKEDSYMNAVVKSKLRSMETNDKLSQGVTGIDAKLNNCYVQAERPPKQQGISASAMSGKSSTFVSL